MYKVLVADDEPIERQVISKKIMGFYPDKISVVTAENGAQAVELFSSQEFDAIILDISMPGINGIEAATEIRKQDKNVAIIFLTAYDDFNYAKAAIGLRALDYLLKPGKDEELYEVLEEAFYQKQYGLNSTSSKPQSNYSDGEDEDRGVGTIAKEIKTLIEENYKEDISLQFIAEKMGYSDAYFCKLFKNCFDQNFISYLNDFRVKKAVELLGNNKINIKNISSEVGYRDPNYFARIFKQKTGHTPSEYRSEVLKV